MMTGRRKRRARTARGAARRPNREGRRTTGFTAVSFQPAAGRALQKGIDQIVAAVGPTLGPSRRSVAIERLDKDKAPELLDNGGLIARRIIQLADRKADVGAMFLRHVLWRQYVKAGDGVATAAVMFREVYDHSLRYLAAGGSAQPLRRHLQAGQAAILEALTEMTRPLKGKDRLAGMAETICHDGPLAKMLGEILDVVGPFGRVDVRSGRSRGLEREYVESMTWEGGLLSRDMMTNRQTLSAELEDAWIMISDLTIEDGRQLVPVLDEARRAGARDIVVLAKKLPDSALGLLRAASQNDEKRRAIAVKTPGSSADKTVMALTDMAILTGGRPVFQAAGESLDGIKAGDFGRARKVWANAHHFGIIAGKGDARQLRSHLAGLRAAYRTAADGDRDAIQARIGSLSGGSANLWVGGLSEPEMQARKELAERTIRALRGACLDGVVPGGGAALLACRPAIRAGLSRASGDDERAAARILLRALEAPFRTLAANSGFDPGTALAALESAGPGCAFDVIRGSAVRAAEAGLFDAAEVQKSAVASAVSGAALALTIDVVVRHQRPVESADP